MKKIIKQSVVLTTTVLIVCLITGHAHTCIHDELDHSFDLGMEMESHSIRGRALAEWEPIRVKADYSLLWNLSQPYRDFIQYVAFPAAIERIQNTYSIIRYTTPLKAPANKTTCHGKPIPNELLTDGMPDTDLLIIVNWVNKPTANFVASAIYCALDATTSRPYLGTIDFNTHFLHTSERSWQNTLSVTLHELHHVLFFSAGLFPHYIDAFTMQRKNNSFGYIHIDGIETVVFIDPLVVQAAREYFNCSSLKLVRLENQGTAGNRGSHWERRWFGNEFITAETSTRMVLSHMTLVLAEASGWYKPNYTLAEKLYWGKDRGCDFVKEKCVAGNPLMASGPEFCVDPKERGCDFESTSPSLCFTRTGAVPNPSYWNYYGNNVTSGDQFTDNCATYARIGSNICGPGGYSTGHSPEYFGNSSACFKSAITYEAFNQTMQGHCYQYKCVKNKDSDNYTLLVIVKSQIFTCKFLGEAIKTHVPGLKGNLICPDPQSFCKIKMETCDQACGGNGNCVEGKCVCPEGRIGPDCLRYATVENDTKCACSFPAVNSYNGTCVCPGFNCTDNALPSASDCSACIPHCAGCSNVNNCTVCEKGYEANNGTCLPSNSSSTSSDESAAANRSLSYTEQDAPVDIVPNEIKASQFLP